MNTSQVNKKIEIHFSRKKLLTLLAITVGFCAIGCWMIFQSQKVFNFHFIPIPTKILGVCCILFFGLAALLIFKRMSGNKPAVTIDDLGIEFRYGLSDEYLLWQDIHSVSTMQIKKQRFIMIELKDPAKYFHQKSRLTQLFLKFNQRIWKGHISLSANGMDTSFDDLYKLIRERVFINTFKPVDRFLS